MGTHKVHLVGIEAGDPERYLRKSERVTLLTAGLDWSCTAPDHSCRESDGTCSL